MLCSINPGARFMINDAIATKKIRFWDGETPVNPSHLNITKVKGQTQVSLIKCINCMNPFSAGFQKKRMNETRKFLDWHKSKGKQNYVPAYTMQFCPTCDRRLFENASKIFGEYFQWPHVALAIVPPGTDPSKPPEHLTRARPNVYKSGPQIVEEWLNPE